MEVLHSHCCGLDVHEKTVVACLLTAGTGPKPKRQVRSFGTFTRDLEALADWLGEGGCTDVAMESTGSYWKPVYNQLDSRFSVIVVNARHLKAVPGRKSDVRDAEWIADLLQHGLLKASFVPQRAQREMRELTRYRAKKVQERASEVNRIQKMLQEANIKLGQVASSVVGVSGRAMLEQLAAGETDPEELAKLARGQLAKKREALVAALTGSVGEHLRFMLKEQLGSLRELDERIVRLDAEIARRQVNRGEEETVKLLDTIPGVAETTARTLLAEVGTDMDVFGSAERLSSWAGVCPGMEESAAKNASGRTPKGNATLRTALVQAAHATSRTDTFLGALYRRLARRLGPSKAAMAVAHRILVYAFHMMKNKAEYRELGASYQDARQKERSERHHRNALERLGYQVTLAPAATPV